jgi:oligopeptidase B
VTTKAEHATIAAPSAKRVAHVRTHHGESVDDPYAWLADQQDPDTIAYLTAENEFAAASTEHLAGLRDELFAEIKGRVQETDMSVPVRRGAWWYYTRTVEGSQYGIHCRRAVEPGESAPPATDGPLPGEQVLLDENELAAGHDFFALGAFAVSPSGELLAYSTDVVGDERYTLHVKDLTTGELLPDEVRGLSGSCAWSAASHVFYTIVDDAWRPYQIWRHELGTPASDDVLVLQEDDEKFRVAIRLCRSQRYLMIGAHSSTTSEVRLLDAADPTGDAVLVTARQQGVDYHVEHQDGPDGGRLLVLHNKDAENFEIASAPVHDPATWTPLIPHRADTRLLDVDAFADHLVVYFRRDALTGLRLIDADGGTHEIAFDEPLYTVSPHGNPEYATTTLRFGYTSMVTPNSVYEYDISSGEQRLLKQTPVRTLPGGRPFDPADYVQHREWATAPDGVRVPISVAHRADVPQDGSAPAVLVGYGSYELSNDPYFSAARYLPLLDRGFVLAIAHVRGGGEMGRRWYDDGKLLAKRNTFTDFVACARHLAELKWTAADRLVIQGGSAGGLLMGAVANMAPDAFAGVVAVVPFVDALNTILDPSLPLTVGEWEEWGDPLHDPEVYAYMKSYTPYENIATDVTYPPILALGSLNDTRVLYHEPAKWIARLRAEASGGPFLLKTEMGAGHAGPSGRYDAWHRDAYILAWIIDTATGRS